MAWDETSPVGTDAINQGDNVIRQMKSDVRQYTAEEHVALTLVPSTLTGYHKFSSGTTSARPSTNTNARRIYLNSQIRQIQVENLGDTLPGSSGWFSGGTPIFPSGTAMVFYQATPPTGWTAVALNDRALRVVTSGGTGGSTGGTTAFSSTWAASTTGAEASHTHTTVATTCVDGGDEDATTSSGSTAPNVNDKFLRGIGGTDVGTFNYRVSNAVFPETATGVGSSHTHTTPAYAPQYADVVVATMD